jgi:Gluconate 2-dehydrogenase subunit 3
MKRRDAIKLGTAATLAVSLGVSDACGRQSGTSGVLRTAGRFLTAAEFALLDELSELIIPADEHSSGARAANVAAFIDGQLAEAWEEKDRATWRDGLTLVERISREMNGKPFMGTSADQRAALLTRMARNESQPQKPEEVFFVELKSRVVHAYYSSEIGIKQEMEYKGNVFLQDFVGEDVSKR